MPKNRRGQSSVQQQTVSRSGMRTKKDAKSLAREEEKENFGRQTTESRQHRRSGVLGATTTLGISSAAAKASSKGVVKRKLPQVKEKKLPLQDITSQFLPAPESANRGASEGAELTLPIEDLSYHMATVPYSSRHLNLLSSPLPPSSPPPDLVLPVVQPSHLGSKLLDSTDDYVDDRHDDPSLPDNKYDAESNQQRSLSSDPFGFVALERKLKEERKFVRELLAARADVDDEDIYEELHEILVADTSSPRPVPRIKPSLIHPEEERQSSECESQDDAIEGAPALLTNPHFSTPPTPQKDKRVRRRHSCEGPDIFSPCSSSLESSPSPTKTSANKRRRDTLYGQDPLEEFNTTVDEIGCARATIDKPPSKRQCKVLQKQDDGNRSTITWNLRPRRPTAPEKAKTVSKPPKDVSRPKSRKAKSNSSKKLPNAFDDDDWEEMWNREREDRIKYFHRLAEYSVEKENVYII